MAYVPHDASVDEYTKIVAPGVPPIFDKFLGKVSWAPSGYNFGAGLPVSDITIKQLAGGIQDQWRQIGNAVPPGLAEALASQIRVNLDQ